MEFTDERLPQRFWSKVTPAPDGCWLWTASVDRDGYAHFVFPGTQRAHRASYSALVGPIPDGYVIDHLCRVRHCVNPEHLEAVTDAENRRRGMGYGLQNGMRKTCIRGHEYTEENTYMIKGERPQCRTCQRDAMARCRARRVGVRS